MRSILIKILLQAWIIWPSFFFASSASAHEVRPAIANVSFTTQTYEIKISANMEAVIAGVSPKHADTDESPNAQRYNRLRSLSAAELQQRIRDFETTYLAGIVLEFDGVRVTPKIKTLQVPEVGDTARSRLSLVHLSGPIPPGAREFRWAYSPEFGQSIVRLPAVGGGEMVALWLKSGEKSEPYILGVGLQQKTRFETIEQYTVLGFTHILPKGLDHILFVLGLFLLSTRLKPLLWQVTAFTVAHSITLGLSIYGVFSLSPAIVEPLIAASIAYVAIENILTSRLHSWRVLVVFCFGLLHGMGFAGVLLEVGLPRTEFLTGLLSFNLGVEFGQLAVISLAYLAMGMWFKDRTWYRRRVVIPASAMIALTGLYWTAERVLG